MFSLGNKEAIVNTAAHYPVTSDTGTDMLTIEGFGKFQDAQLVSAECQRFKSSRNEVMAITAPTAAELGITTTNVPVTFGIVVKTFRDISEYSTDFIVNGRPIVFEILVSTGDDSTAVGATIQSALDEWVSKFNHATLPFTSSTTSGVVTLTMVDYTFFFKNRVEFKVDREITPIISATTKVFDSGNTGTVGGTAALITVDTSTGLTVGDTVTIGTSIAAGETQVIIAIDGDTSITLDASITWVAADTIYLHTTALDPTFDGKYLEENARMSLSTTSDSYGISPDEKPIIAGEYTTLSWIMNDAVTEGAAGIDGQHAKHAFLGSTRGEIGGTRQFKFTLYVLEDTAMFTATTGAVDKIVEWMVASPITPVLRIANGQTVATSDLFIA